MPTNPNMVAIQTVTVGSGGAANIEFTNIPQTYTDLVISFSIRCVRSDVVEPVMIRFNSTTSGYSLRRLTGDGSTVSSSSVSGETGMIIGDINGNTSTSNTFGNGVVYIPNYTSSNNKSVSTDVVVENNATTSSQYLLAGLWSNSAAIDTIRLYSRNSHNFMQYSTATLYGVTSAQGSATGGVVTSDANYYYHTFLASGTFTPLKSLSCDILMIAGGGSGGTNYGGGGGAGGVVYETRSLSAQAYTVTIGAGGSGVSPQSRGNNGSNTSFTGSTTAVGGGGGGEGGTSSFRDGKSGGSGGGASYSGTGGAATSGQGFAGGIGKATGGAGVKTGGGGGAGGTPAAAGDTQPGNGGIGTSTYSTWGLATSTGQNSSGTYYYAGGGGGVYQDGTPQGTGGLGGGAAGASGTNNGNNATANTGGGGGGCVGGDPSGAGGSGIVIVRYAK